MRRVVSAAICLYCLCIVQHAMAQSPAASSKFGYASAQSTLQMTTDLLVAGGHFQRAVEIAETALRLRPADSRERLNRELLLIELLCLQHIGDRKDLRTEYDALRQAVLQDAEQRIATWQSETYDSLPTPNDRRLFHLYALSKGRVELARRIIATRLALQQNEQLARNAQIAIADCLDQLSALIDSANQRAAELSQHANQSDSILWTNELQRLSNEALMLRIDTLAMQLQQSALMTEGDRIAAATRLLQEIGHATTLLATENAFDVRLNRLRAMGLAHTGHLDEALQLLDDDALKLRDVRGQFANRVLAVELLLDQNREAAVEDARQRLNTILTSATEASPELALVVLRFKATTAAESAQSNIALDSQTISPEILYQVSRVELSRKDQVALKDLIGQVYGEYWRLRAEGILYQNAVGESSNSDAIIAQAKQDVLAGRIAQARQRLTDAAARAQRAGDIETEFQLQKLQFALLYKQFLQQRGDRFTDESIRAQLELARQWSSEFSRYTTTADADEIHLVAFTPMCTELLGHAGELLPEVNVTAIQVAAAHLVEFPDSDSSINTLKSLIQLELANGNYASAADRCQKLSEDSTLAQTQTVATELRLAVNIIEAACSESFRTNGSSTSQIAIASGHWSRADEGLPKQTAAPVWYNDLAQQLVIFRTAELDDAISLQDKDVDAGLVPMTRLSLVVAKSAELAQRVYKPLPKIDRSWLERFESMHQQLKADLQENVAIASNAEISDFAARVDQLNRALSGQDRESALNDARQLADSRRTFSNMQHFARLLALGSADELNKADRLYRILLNQVPPGGMIWWDLNADRLLAAARAAKQSGANLDNILQQVELVARSRADCPDRWLESVKNAVNLWK